MNDDYKCCPTCGQIVLSPAQQARATEELRRSREDLRALTEKAAEALADAYGPEVDEILDQAELDVIGVALKRRKPA